MLLSSHTLSASPSLYPMTTSSAPSPYFLFWILLLPNPVSPLSLSLLSLFLSLSPFLELVLWCCLLPFDCCDSRLMQEPVILLLHFPRGSQKTTQHNTTQHNTTQHKIRQPIDNQKTTTTRPRPRPNFKCNTKTNYSNMTLNLTLTQPWPSSVEQNMTLTKIETKNATSSVEQNTEMLKKEGIKPRQSHCRFIRMWSLPISMLQSHILSCCSVHTNARVRLRHNCHK